MFFTNWRVLDWMIFLAMVQVPSAILLRFLARDAKVIKLVELYFAGVGGYFVLAWLLFSTYAKFEILALKYIFVAHFLGSAAVLAIFHVYIFVYVARQFWIRRKENLPQKSKFPLEKDA